MNGDTMDKMNYTYIVRCSDGTLYTGWTTDVERRVRTHNSGKGAKYTRSRLPVTLVYYETYPTRQEAMRREWEIKQLTREEKKRLIDGKKHCLESEKPLIDDENHCLEGEEYKKLLFQRVEKAMIEKSITPIFAKNINEVIKIFEMDQIWGRKEIREELSYGDSKAGKTIEVMQLLDVIDSVKGKGKGKYVLKKFIE